MQNLGAAPRLAESESLSLRTTALHGTPAWGQNPCSLTSLICFMEKFPRVNRTQNVNQDGGPLKCHKDIIIVAFRPDLSDASPS